MKKAPFVFSLVAMAVSTGFAAEEQATIRVEASAIPEPVESVTLTSEDVSGPHADGGDFLRNVTGVSGTRMGGHGIDPIIRGQSQTRLNILLDGAYVHGGCPNRMDPPTAYSPMETYDSVTVIKGSQTVIYGGGGSGGTAIFERITPRLEEDEKYRANVEAGYRSNGDAKEIAADVTGGNTQGFIRGIASYADADNYEDGDGNEVRSAYTVASGNIIAGFTPDDATRVELGIEKTREDDVLFEGAKMDSPWTENDTYRLKYIRDDQTGPFAAMKAEFYSSNVEHLMDNYSLRPNTGTWAKAPSTSDTMGGRITTELDTGGSNWTLGFDYQKNERDAEKYVGPSGSDPSNLQSIMWPGAELAQTGIFAEVYRPVSTEGAVKLGMRYDYVDASISRGNDTTSTLTPNELYTMFYERTSESTTENNVGGFLRYEHEVGSNDSMVYASVSRSVRTADATERFLANNMNGMMMSWVGNNMLEPEKHHQAEVGISWHAKGWNNKFSLYYNSVSDYILIDKARMQDGILVGNGTATIYRNIDARLYGFEWEGDTAITDTITGRATLAYVNATNTTDDRPLAQTPPLEATVALDYKVAMWGVGGQVRAQAKQTRADLDNGSGVDIQETPGWAVLDLYGHVNLGKQAVLKLGIDNVFDKTYAYHVNREGIDPLSGSTTGSLVNEPGRSVWVKAAIDF